MRGSAIAAAIALGLALPAIAQGRELPPTAVASVAVFQERLAPYGRWVASDRYGQVWRPSAVAGDWRPYTVGRWVHTADFGWYWDSAEPWGWATYHYGRWALDPTLGWVWLPDTVWGPSWVAWRWGGGYAGWAPLPPQIGFSFASGFGWGGFGFTEGWYRPAWTFVPAGFVTYDRVWERALPAVQNETFINRTSNITSYRVVNERVVDNSLDLREVARATGRPVVSQRVVPAGVPGAPATPGTVVAYHPPELSPHVRGVPAAWSRPSDAAELSRTEATELRATAAEQREAAIAERQSLQAERQSMAAERQMMNEAHRMEAEERAMARQQRSPEMRPPAIRPPRASSRPHIR